MSEPKGRCPKCGAHNAYGGDAETYPCSRCGFDGRALRVVTKEADFDELLHGFRISPTELITAVRAGVESGTIKGEVVRWCESHNAEGIENHGGASDECWRVVWADHKADEGLPLTGYRRCRIVGRLAVSDGGSET